VSGEAALDGEALTPVPDKEQSMSIKEQIEDQVQKLKQMRDELDVQAHLAGADAKDEVKALWHKAEHEYAKLEAEVSRIAGGAEEPLENIAEAAQMLLGEIKTGYTKIRELI
jgi:hypothetical protein